MGTSRYICKKCSEHYELDLHEEDNYGSSYKAVRNAACSGEYGPEWQAAFNNIIEVAIDCTKKLYYCDDCGYWENEKDLSLFIPKSPEALEKIRNAKIRIQRFGSVPQVMRNDLKNNYQ